jgi:Tol biopolymer transport system component
VRTLAILGTVAVLAVTATPGEAASRLLYATTWSGPSQIYALDPAARTPAQVTFGLPRSCDPLVMVCGFTRPVPSPDGSHVAFTDAQFCQVGLYVAKANGDGRRRLARSAENVCAFPFAVAWTPDSRRLAYSFGATIYLVNADGGGPRFFAIGSRPAWSPDGRSLAYLTPGVSGRQGALAVRTGKRSRILARDVGDFGWSPKGNWIVFERQVNTPYTRRVELIRPNGGGARVLSESYALGLGWSRDGRFIAFLGKDGIEVINVATGAGRTLGGPYGSDHPWSPTGNRLAFDSERGVQIHDPVANTTRLISPEHAREIVWAPDGRSLAYVASTFTTGYNSGGDLRIATTSGAVRTVVPAAGDYGGVISGLAWSKSPTRLRYRRAAGRTIAQVTPNELVAPWPVERIAADGGRVAYVSCGHVFVWTPSANRVTQAEPIASLAPRCSTPGNYVAFQIYTLALAGDRLAFGHRDGNMGQSWSLDAGTFTSTPRMSQLEIRYGSAGCTEGDRGLGSLAGAADLLVFSTWRDRFVGGCPPLTEHQEIRRLEAGGCPCPVIASSPGPFVPFDVEGGRIVAGGENATLLLDADGRQLRSIAVSPLAAQLSGADVVVLTSGALRHYDAGTGALLHSWTLPNVSAGVECGRPHGSGWECRSARLVLQDAARGLAAYVLDGQIHLVRLADGADAVVAAGSRARFMDAGLVYADGARLRLIPYASLPLRGF